MKLKLKLIGSAPASNKNLALLVKPLSTAPIKIIGTRGTYKVHISTNLQNWQYKS